MTETAAKKNPGSIHRHDIRMRCSCSEQEHAERFLATSLPHEQTAHTKLTGAQRGSVSYIYNVDGLQIYLVTLSVGVKCNVSFQL